MVCTRAADNATCSRRLRRAARPPIAAIHRCPILDRVDGAIAAAWAIAETVKTMRKPLDIQATATEGGLECRLARIRAADDVRNHGAGARRRAAPAGTARVTARSSRNGRPRRSPWAAHALFSARGVPAGDRGRRSRAGGAGAGALRQGRQNCGPVRRCRAVRTAARRTRARHRRRQRQGRGRRAQTRRRDDAGPQADRGGDARPVPAADGGSRAKRRLRRIRPAAPGRRGAGTRARGSAVPFVVAVSCNPATSPAMPAFSPTAAIASRGSRRSTSSSIRRTWRSWRGWRNTSSISPAVAPHLLADGARDARLPPARAARARL